MQASRAATALVRRAGAVAVAAVAPTRAAGAMCCRAFSAVVSPFEAPDADFVTFPREQPGLDYSLNWSLADDDVTPRGRAFRNADQDTLLDHLVGKVADSGVAECGLGSDPAAPLYCTDEAEGFVVADIDEFEERFEKLKESFSAQPNLFVEDGAVGSDRASEIRVRVITDSANYALFFRNMLSRVPLKDAQTFPRPLTVYIATNHDDGAYSVSDFDPETGRGVVAVSGSPGFEPVLRQIEHVAAQMFDHGGYQGQRGGGHRLQLAREDGSLEFDDSHYIADSGAEDLLFLRGSASLADDGSTTIHVGDEPPAGALHAAHACVWNAAGVAQFWGGANLQSAPDAARGAIACTGRTAVPVESALTAPHPSTIAVSGGAKDAAELASKLGLSESAAALLATRVASHKVKIVASGAAPKAKKAAPKAKKAAKKSSAAKKK